MLSSKSISINEEGAKVVRYIFDRYVAGAGSTMIAYFTGFGQLEGIVSMIIGIMMFYVVGTVFLDNARGVIGETDEEMMIHIGNLVLEDPNISDIARLEVVKEGEFLHVELVESKRLFPKTDLIFS